jgi:hypothetical protein
VIFGGACDGGSTPELRDCGACECIDTPGTCKIDGGSKLEDDATCMGGGVAVSGPNCVDTILYQPTDIYFQGTVSINQAGTCAPGLEPVDEMGCEFTAATECGMGMVCVPAGPSRCKSVMDNNNCVLGHVGYPNPRTLYEGGECECACATVTENCAAQVTLHSDNLCTQGAVLVAANNMCVLSNANLVEGVKAPDTTTITCTEPTYNMNLTPRPLCCQ